MKAKLIKNDADHAAALARIEDIFDAKPGTPEGDECELLVHLVEEYEAQHHAIDLPDPIEAIKFRMEQQGLKQADLIPFIGNKSKVSEVLSRKRPLSLAMIRGLHKGLGIPAAVLLQEPGKIRHHGESDRIECACARGSDKRLPCHCRGTSPV